MKIGVQYGRAPFLKVTVGSERDAKLCGDFVLSQFARLSYFADVVLDRCIIHCPRV